MTTEKTDLIFASLPYKILRTFQIPLYPGLFTEPFSAFGSWRFCVPGRPLCGALGRV